MKYKKVMLGLSSVAAIAGPVAAVVSCGESSTHAIVFDPFEEFTGKKIYLALDGYTHSDSDNSFNQQGKEAIQDYITKYPQDKMQSGGSLKPTSSGDSEADFHQMYSTAEQHSIIIAPGYLHINPLKSVSSETDNKAVILLDGSVASPNIISVYFRVEQAAYLAGYSFVERISSANAADFLTYDRTKDGKILVSTFGGQDIPTVTGFMYGFKKGFDDALAEFSKTNTDLKNKLSFFTFPTREEHFSGGFQAGGGDAISAKMKAAGVDIVLPVAGPQTIDALNLEMYTIGVDVAQESVLTPEQIKKGKVLFSILKDLRTAGTQAIRAIITKDFTSLRFNHASYVDLEDGAVGMSAGDTAVKAIYDKYFNDKNSAPYKAATSLVVDFASTTSPWTI